MKPTGASRSTPSVPRKSRSPSARTRAGARRAPARSRPSRSVTPAQATSASSSMSPEHASEPVPPVAGCRPASTSARPVSTVHAICAVVELALGPERDERRRRLVAVALFERFLHRLQCGPVHVRILERRSKP